MSSKRARATMNKIKRECSSPGNDTDEPEIEESMQEEEDDPRRPSLSEARILGEFDYSFGGIDMRDQLPGPSHVSEVDMESFMLNELPYSRLLQQMDGSGPSSSAVAINEPFEEEEEEEEEVEDEEIEDEEVDVVNPFSFSGIDLQRVHNESENEDEDEMEEYEEEEEEQMQPTAKKRALKSILDEDLLKNLPSDLKGQLLVNDSGEFAAPKDEPVTRRGRTGGSIKKMGMNHMDALIGQANLMYAKGQTSDALQMLLEVIRQNPRDPEAYLQVSQMYNELAKPLEALQYGLLGAHLSSKTPAGDWSYLGDLAYQLERMEEAAACYFKAVKMEPTNWIHYEKRINVLDKLGLTSLSMKTRLIAANAIDHIVSNVSFDWLKELIMGVADYYIATQNEAKAIEALDTFVLRSHQFGIYAEEQHKCLLTTLLKHERYEEAAKSIFALLPDIKPLDKLGQPPFEVTWSNSSYKIKPWPTFYIETISIPDNLPIFIITTLAISLIRIGKPQSVNSLVQYFPKYQIHADEEDGCLEIARSYLATEKNDICYLYLKILNQMGSFSDNPETWYLLGVCCTAKDMIDEAMHNYERVLTTHPQHVDARINLSTLQQNMGLSDKALETLKGHDLDQCTRLPHERLLIRQAEMLFAKNELDEYVRCVRMLLTPHFYQIHLGKIIIRTKRKNQQFGLDNGLRNVALVTLRGTQWEKFVKRLGLTACRDERSLDDLKGPDLHDYAFKLMEVLHGQRRYQEMLHVCCYAFLQAKINTTGRTFLHLLLYSAIRADNWNMAFEYLRWFHQSALVSTDFMPENRDLLFSRIFNAMNFVFCHSQNVCYHRYVMRALVRTPGNHPLQMISGNNSLITGSYRHALGEYMKVWIGNKESNDPMVCMLIGLTFIHISCKKDISSRHMVALRGFAFMRHYEKLRGHCQETLYNIGRMFHQMGMTSIAVHFYNKLLTGSEAPKIWVTDEEDGERRAEVKECYDLKPLAAHNLSLIYESCGNIGAARAVLEKYCVV